MHYSIFLDFEQKWPMCQKLTISLKSKVHFFILPSSFYVIGLLIRKKQAWNRPRRGGAGDGLCLLLRRTTDVITFWRSTHDDARWIRKSTHDKTIDCQNVGRVYTLSCSDLRNFVLWKGENLACWFENLVSFFLIDRGSHLGKHWPPWGKKPPAHFDKAGLGSEYQ